MTTKAGREAWRMVFELLFREEAPRRLSQAAAELGVSPGLLKTLFHLEPTVGVPMRELAEHWRCDASYVTSLTDALEERGLVRRLPHATDRRVKMILLTDEGAAVRQRAFELLSAPPLPFDALTAVEQRQLRDLLRKVATAARRPSHEETASTA